MPKGIYPRTAIHGRRTAAGLKRYFSVPKNRKKASLKTMEQFSDPIKRENHKRGIDKWHKIAKETDVYHKASLKKWKNPKYKNKMLKTRRSKEYCKLRSDIAKELWKDVEYANKINNLIVKEKRIRTFNTPEYKEKRRLIRLGIVFPKKDSKIEKKIQKELRKRNIRFKKHVALIGQPDIFIEPNICIFCDGKFWHGDPRIYGPNDLIGCGKSKGPAKIKWEKDQLVTKKLQDNNYRVLRFWEKEINERVNIVMKEIENAIIVP